MAVGLRMVLMLAMIQGIRTVWCKLICRTSMSSADGVKHRLERIISNRGVGSRNEVSKLLRQGRVSVNGETVRGGSGKFPVDVSIAIDGVPIIENPILAAYHKPLGIHSTMGDRWDRPSLDNLHLKYPFLKSMHPVGRLDADTTGLLLWSRDGQLTHALLHPSVGISRKYEAVVVGEVDSLVLGPKLLEGITTADGKFPAKLLKAEKGIASSASEIERIKLQWETQLSFDEGEVDDIETFVGESVQSPSVSGNKVEEGLRESPRRSVQIGKLEKKPSLGPSSNPLFKTSKIIDSNSMSLKTGAKDSLPSTAVPVVPTPATADAEIPTSKLLLAVTEGKYRMVRRILHNAGHSVISLHRIRYGNVSLSDIPAGEVRICSGDERAWAAKLAREQAKKPASMKDQPQGPVKQTTASNAAPGTTQKLTAASQEVGTGKQSRQADRAGVSPRGEWNQVLGKRKTPTRAHIMPGGGTPKTELDILALADKASFKTGDGDVAGKTFTRNRLGSDSAEKKKSGSGNSFKGLQTSVAANTGNNPSTSTAETSAGEVEEEAASSDGTRRQAQLNALRSRVMKSTRARAIKPIV